MAYDESEREPLTQPDTPNQTKFHPDDADHDSRHRADGTATFEQHYSRLARLNTGVYNGKWADENKRNHQGSLAVFDAIAGQLELTPYQKRASRQAFDSVDCQRLSTPGGIDTPLIAIMVAAVIVRQDGRVFHPSRSDARNDDLFLALLRDFTYSDHVVHSSYEKVRDALREDQ